MLGIFWACPQTPRSLPRLALRYDAFADPFLGHFANRIGVSFETVLELVPHSDARLRWDAALK